MKKILKNILIQIFCTKIGWLMITLLLALTFGLLSTYYFWAEMAMYVSLVYPVIFLLVIITYAWIVNPIRERKETKKLKDGNKE